MTVLEPAMTVREVASFLSVDEKTIYRLVQKGELPGFKVAGAWRFQRADLQRWIDVRKTASLSEDTQSGLKTRSECSAKSTSNVTGKCLSKRNTRI